MACSPTTRAASHLFWCTVLFVGLLLAILPRHANAAPRPPCHGVVIAAVANLKLSLPAKVSPSGSETDNRKCRPHNESPRGVLWADGVDPVADPGSFELLPRAAGVWDAPYSVLVVGSFESRSPRCMRSRSPPA